MLTYLWDLYQSFMFGHLALEGQGRRGRPKDTKALVWGLQKVIDDMEIALGTSRQPSLYAVRLGIELRCTQLLGRRWCQ